MSATALERLQTLAAGLCRDADVTVVEGPGGAWFFTPATGTITVGADDLRVAGPEYCAGVLAHEVGHVFISRYLEMAPDFEVPEILMGFLNGIEDPRVNTWIKRRYPGAGPWQERMRERDVTPILQVMPAWFRYTLECAREEYLGWAPADSVGPVPWAVLSELEKTRTARRAYAETLPPENLVPAMPETEISRRYEESVAPIYNQQSLAPSADAWEKTVRLSQREALLAAERELLPGLRALLDLDLGRIADFIRSQPSLKAAARRSLGSDLGVSAFLGRALEHRPHDNDFPVPVGEERRLALAILTRQARDAWQPPSQAGAPILPGGRGDSAGTPTRREPSPRTAPRPVELPPPSDLYERTRVALSRQIDSLSGTLEELFQPRRRMRERTGLPHGDRVDLRKLVAFEADVRLYRRLWRRKTIPERRDHAISVLVDLSGSMRQDDRIYAAFKGMVLMAEVLHRHQVEFSISGFQDVVIPLHPFGAPFTKESRAVLEGMVLEVEGARPGGHNQPGQNFDGPCLLEVADRLAEQPASDRLLVVISDGEPSGPARPELELKKAVASVEAMAPAIELIGLGLGAGTDHVSRFYPRSRASIPEVSLAEEIGNLIQSALLG